METQPDYKLMGTCARKKLKMSAPPFSQLDLKYPQRTNLKVRTRNSIRRQSFIEVEFKLPRPIKVLIEDSFPCFPNSKVSLCVIPGINPKQRAQKVCQDNCFFIKNSDSVLLALFDGHGVNGEKVVEFLSNTTIESFQKFSNKVKIIHEDFESFLKQLSLKCALGLEKVDFDCSLSGRYFLFSTQIMVLLTPTSIFSCNIGDSRAVLGTGTSPGVNSITRSHLLSNQEFSKAKFVRSQNYSRYLMPHQLSKDHKPNDPEESRRVCEMGGKVDRNYNSSGIAVGPFRISDPSGLLPGISVSRIQGDYKLRSLGVISESSIKKYPIKRDDFFVVLASDGVWDVMENEEVVAFIETYRSSCQNHFDNTDTIDIKNSCIAQLLCEEARLRWLHLMNYEDVNMDDISCIIFEIKDTPEYMKSSQNQSNDFEQRLSTSSGFMTLKDSQRNSWVLPSTESFVVNNI